MAQKYLGMEAANALNKRIRTDVMEFLEKGIQPTLAVIRIGENPGDLYYEKKIEKVCADTGVRIKKIIFQESVVQEEVVKMIRELNQDEQIHGIFLYRPLPKFLDQELLENVIAPEKDVDGCTNLSLAGVYTSKKTGFAPCISDACVYLLNHYGLNLTGKKVTVIGRSLIAGKSTAMAFINANATVTICHTKTENMSELTKKADILIAAAGYPHLIGEPYVRAGQIVMDLGIHSGKDQKELYGDIIFEEVEPVVKAITPVPGGVGELLPSILMSHVVEACKRSFGGY